MEKVSRAQAQAPGLMPSFRDMSCAFEMYRVSKWYGRELFSIAMLFHTFYVRCWAWGQKMEVS